MVRKKVIKLNWDNANDKLPVVLMSKAQRNELGITAGQLVDVKYLERETKAVVHPQFRQLIAQDGVSINNVLSNGMGIGMFEMIELSKSEVQLPQLPPMTI